MNSTIQKEIYDRNYLILVDSLSSKEFLKVSEIVKLAMSKGANRQVQLMLRRMIKFNEVAVKYERKPNEQYAFITRVRKK